MLPLCREPQGKGRLQKPLQGSLGCQGGGLSPKWLWFAATLVAVPSLAPRTLTAPISRWVGVQRGCGASGNAPRAAKQDPGLASHIGASAHGFEKGTCGRGARRRICRPGPAFWSLQAHAAPEKPFPPCQPQPGQTALREKKGKWLKQRLPRRFLQLPP